MGGEQGIAPRFYVHGIMIHGMAHTLENRSIADLTMH